MGLEGKPRRCLGGLPLAFWAALTSQNVWKTMGFCSFPKHEHQNIVFLYTRKHHENRAVAYTRAQFSILNAWQKLIFSISQKCRFVPGAYTRARLLILFCENDSKLKRLRDASGDASAGINEIAIFHMKNHFILGPRLRSKCSSKWAWFSC